MSFDNYGLQQELKRVWDEKLTGTFSCEIKGFDKKLFINNGVVCFATSTDPEDKLPNVLMRQGHFTDDQYESAEANFNENISIGRNLVEMGLINQQELMDGAKQQIYTVFAACMLADRGTMNFEEGELPNGIVSLPLKYPRDFFRALLSMEDKTWLSAQFGASLNFIPVPDKNRPLDLGKLELGDFAEPLYELIDGELNFNHIAFEADVDDFLLLKFLYALKFMGHITLESDEEEEEPEVDDFRDDFGSAMEQREELERLQGMGLEGAALDETIATGDKPGEDDVGLDNLAAMAAMDVTMEISRDALGDTPLGEAADETGEIQLPDGFGEEQMPQEEEIAEAEAAFEAGFETEDNEEDGEESRGLDDLSDMSADIFEQEMEKMEDGKSIPEGVIMPDEEEEDEDEEETEAGEPPAWRRLLLIGAAGLISAGLLLMLRPYILRNVNPYSTTVAQVEPDPVEVDPPADPSPEQPQEALIPDQEIPQQAETDQPKVEEPKPEQAEVVTQAGLEQPEEAASQVTEAPDKVTEAPGETPITQPPKQVEPEQVQADDPTQVEEPNRPDGERFEIVHHSPVVERWSTQTQRPRDRYQAPVNLPPVRPMGAETNLLASDAGRTGPISPETRPPKLTANNKSNPKTEPPPVKAAPLKAAPDRAPKSSPRVTPPRPVAAGDAGAAAAQLSAQNYLEAARIWQRVHQNDGDQFTLGLFLVCDPANVAKAYSDAGGNPKLFILPRRVNNKTCYWVCWGTYSSRIKALSARKELPEGLIDPRGVEIYRLSGLL